MHGPGIGAAGCPGRSPKQFSPTRRRDRDTGSGRMVCVCGMGSRALVVLELVRRDASRADADLTIPDAKICGSCRSASARTEACSRFRVHGTAPGLRTT